MEKTAYANHFKVNARVTIEFKNKALGFDMLGCDVLALHTEDEYFVTENEDNVRKWKLSDIDRIGIIPH